jgi:prepilin-type N-terminal cleavage/methylation domain-containing protein
MAYLELEKKYNRTTGFTLIEILIAICILSFGLLAIGGMQIASINGNADARHITDISTIAADRIEKMMLLAYDDTALSSGTHSKSSETLTFATDGIDNDNDGEIDETGGETISLNTDGRPVKAGDTTIEWTVQDNTPLNNTKTITLTVYRADKGGRKHVEMVYVKSNVTQN